MLFRIHSGFKSKIFCDTEPEKKAERRTGKEVGNPLQKEWCQGFGAFGRWDR